MERFEQSVRRSGNEEAMVEREKALQAKRSGYERETLSERKRKRKSGRHVTRAKRMKEEREQHRQEHRQGTSERCWASEGDRPGAGGKGRAKRSWRSGRCSLSEWEGNRAGD